jgi:hypothetical protein
MSRRFTFTTFIERGDDELEVRVTYTVTQFMAATYWQPAEGGEVEVELAEFVGVDRASMPAPLTVAEIDRLVEEAEGRAYKDMAADAADRAAYLYDLRRDRLLDEQIDREFGK